MSPHPITPVLSRRFRLIAGLAIVAALLSGTPTPALAVSCPSCVAATERVGAENINQHQQTRSYLNGRIEAMKDALIQVITKTSQDSTTAITRQQSEAARAQSESDLALEKATEKERIKNSIPSGACGNSASANGPRSGGRNGASGKSGGNYMPSSELGPRLTSALGSSGVSSELVPPPKDLDIQAADIGVGGCNAFNAPGTLRGILCESAGFKQAGTIANRIPNGDIEASSLFNGAKHQGQTQRALSVPERGVERDALKSFVMNATSARPLPSMDTEALKTEKGIVYLGHYNEYNSVKSMAMWPINEFTRLISSPSADDAETRKSLNAAYQAMAKDDKAFVDDYLSKAGPGGKRLNAEDMSPLELMNLEVERRAGNPDWVKRAVGMTDLEKAAEVMYMQAYALRLQFAQYDAQLQTNVLLGQIINMNAEVALRPRVDPLSNALNISKDKMVDTNATK